MKFRSLNRLDLTALILGFGLGAFIIIPLLIKKNVVKDNNEKVVVCHGPDWTYPCDYTFRFRPHSWQLSVVYKCIYARFVCPYYGDKLYYINNIIVIMSKSISRHFYLAAIPLVGFLYIYSQNST